MRSKPFYKIWTDKLMAKQIIDFDHCNEVMGNLIELQNKLTIIDVLKEYNDH